MIAVPRSADGHYVWKSCSRLNVAHLQRIEPIQNPRDPHSELRSRFHQVDVFVTRRLPNGLKNGAADLVAVHDRIDAPAMKEHVKLALHDHFGHDVLERLRVDSRIHAGLAVDDSPVQFLQSPHHLLADALAQLPLAAHNMPDNDQHQPAGPESAKMAVAFDEGDLCAPLVWPPGRPRPPPARLPRPGHRSGAAASTPAPVR